MRPFRSNQKRIRNRGTQDKSFKRSNEINRLNSDFGNRENVFRRKNNRNNGNVDKLILKYNELAREALSNGDKILSENYFQHAEHFIRILGEREVSLSKNEESKVNPKIIKEEAEEKNKKVKGSSEETSKKITTTEN